MTYTASILIVLCATCILCRVLLQSWTNTSTCLFVRQLCSKLLMTHIIIIVSDTNMPNLRWICLFLGGTNFLSLTHYDMLQLLIELCLNFLTKQQLTSQRPGNLLRQSQVGSCSWNETWKYTWHILEVHAVDVWREPVPCTRITTKDE